MGAPCRVPSVRPRAFLGHEPPRVPLIERCGGSDRGKAPTGRDVKPRALRWWNSLKVVKRHEYGVWPVTVDAVQGHPQKHALQQGSSVLVDVCVHDPPLR